ncbi:MAG: hypothetical protein ABR610_06340 [Thermoanaerobaculia bacterium]
MWAIDVFFYGLFMDVDLLREKGAAPVNPRPASVEGFALRIGARHCAPFSRGARLRDAHLEGCVKCRQWLKHAPEAPRRTGKYRD